MNGNRERFKVHHHLVSLNRHLPMFNTLFHSIIEYIKKYMDTPKLCIGTYMWCLHHSIAISSSVPFPCDPETVMSFYGTLLSCDL